MNDSEVTTADPFPQDIKNCLQELENLYAYAEHIAQALEERLQKLSEWNLPQSPLREI